MPISVDQAISAAPAAPVKPQGVPVDSLYPPTPEPSKGAGIAGAVKSAVTGQSKWWTDYQKLANQYAQALKEDLHASPETPAAALLQSGKTVLDALGAAFSPLESVARTGVIDPATALVQKLGSLVESHVAADEEWTPQERREASLSGKTLGQKYPKGIDWKVHKADVKRTVEDLNRFIETGVLTGVGMVGGKRLPAKLSSRELEALRLEREAQQPKITPDKPRVQITGTDVATGKPRVRVLTPEQASAGASAAMQDIHLDVAPMVRVAPESTIAVRQFAQDWNDLHSAMTPRYEAAMQSGRPVGAHTILDTMLGELDESLATSGRTGNYQREFISRLRKFVDDVPINFVPMIRDAEGTPMGKTAGLYKPASRSIEIRVDPVMSGQSTHAVLHEVTHAATLDWIRSNPGHQLTNELEELLHEAKQSLGRDAKHYGLTNSEEFVAEAMTNPVFQKALLGIRKSGQTMYSRLADIIRRVFGLPESEAGFLHRVMRTSDAIMTAQAASRRALARSTGEAAALEVKVPKIAKPAVDRLAGYVEELTRMVNPEGFGYNAKVAGAVIAGRVAERVHNTAVWKTGAEQGHDFWESNKDLAREFIGWFERGAKFKNLQMEVIAQRYRNWNLKILLQDQKNGILYDPEDNYLSHLFRDEKGVRDFFASRYGSKFGNPKFTQERTFNLYEQAIKAGFEPLYTNPEDIMLARQFASDTAEMKVNILKDLERYGLATQGKTPPPGTSPFRSPNGDWYHIDNKAFQPLHQYFDTRSLWSARGLGGDLFRGLMRLKNAIITPMLSLSGFHLLHVTHIDNADITSMMLKDVLAGQKSAGAVLGEILGLKFVPFGPANLYRSFYSNPKTGGRFIQAFEGRVPKSQLTAEQDIQLQYALEGGFVPRMHDIYRVNMERNLKALWATTLQRPWKLPGALATTLNTPIMDFWIPRLKAASYFRQVTSLLKANPELLNNPAKRKVELRRITKSVDNRYGEMSYDTLFWSRWLKDLGVLNTLSLGWQLGFIREYGGGALDLGQFAAESGKVQAIKAGKLDKPLFVAVYTTTAAGFAGLMTYAMTGEYPSGMDWINPRTGETNPDGTPERVTTPFYTREFAALKKHIESQGVASGVGHLVANKASGVIGLIDEWATELNSFGQEIRDPDAPAFKQLEQTVMQSMMHLEPISIKALRQQAEVSPSRAAMTVAGFQPEPAYMRDTATTGRIKEAYRKYVAPKQTSFDKAQFSEEARKLRVLIKAEDPKWTEVLDEITEKFQLTRGEAHRLVSSVRRGPPPSIKMFQRLDWREQKKILDKMSKEEREIYLPHSNRAHLRRRYEEPVE